jgi:uncharacterized protein
VRPARDTSPAPGAVGDAPGGPVPAAPRLIADAMLGALARWLRVLDLDTAYDPALSDAQLVALAAAEGRVVLSRDRQLLERRLARPQLLIRSERVPEQLRQVLAALGLRPEPQRLFRRCLRCNQPLRPLPTEAAQPQVPEFVARTVAEFSTCPSCRRIYWRGTHVDRMQAWLRRLDVEGVRPASSVGI